MNLDLGTAIARAIAALQQLAPTRSRSATVQALYDTQRRISAASGQIPPELAADLHQAIDRVDDDAPTEACALRRSLAEHTQEPTP